MADEHISLSVLQWIGWLAMQFLATVAAAIKGALVVMAKRDQELSERLTRMDDDISVNKTAVAVLHAQGTRMEKVLDDINSKQDRQMEILLQQRRG